MHRAKSVPEFTIPRSAGGYLDSFGNAPLRCVGRGKGRNVGEGAETSQVCVLGGSLLWVNSGNNSTFQRNRYLGVLDIY